MNRSLAKTLAGLLVVLTLAAPLAADDANPKGDAKPKT